MRRPLFAASITHALVGRKQHACLKRKRPVQNQGRGTDEHGPCACGLSNSADAVRLPVLGGRLHKQPCVWLVRLDAQGLGPEAIDDAGETTSPELVASFLGKVLQAAANPHVVRS